MAAQLARRNGAAAQRQRDPSRMARPAPGNPTDYMILLARSWWTTGGRLVEVWQDADRNPQAQKASSALSPRWPAWPRRNTPQTIQLRQMVGQQALWTQLEG